MKISTLNTLLVAKSIFRKTKSLVNSGDKHSCTAGIIMLQDFVELVVLAALDELDANEQKSLESKSFDELLGELKRLNVPVVKSGTIKALNKQRVISKHYGQLSEPASVVNYYNVAVLFADALLEKVVGSKLQEIFLTDILKESAVKDLVKEAISLANLERYMDSLVALRKAFYMAYEYEYCVYAYRDRDGPGNTLSDILGFGLHGGGKAPYWTKNKVWIEQNVNKPVDYIQVDHEKLRTDCMEWGVSTVDAANFRRLTPAIVETERGVWHFEYDSNFAANELNVENFNYCLDIVLDFLLKKQDFHESHKWPKREKSVPALPIYIGKPIFNKPSQGARVIDYVRGDYYYSVDRVVSGFNASERYLYVHLYPKSAEFSVEGHIWGYLLEE